MNIRSTRLALAALTIWLTMAVLLTGVDGSPGVTHVGHDKVAAAFAKTEALVTAPDLSVLGSHRARPGQVEMHEKETDVFYIIDGEATLVTGGTMVGGKMTKAGQFLGSDIQGGQIHRLSKGDVITISAGTPHWFKEVPRSISYFVVKVLR